MKGVKIFLVLIGLFILVENTANADEVSRKDELKQEIQEVIQKQIPDNQIIEVDWELTEKYQNYVCFDVLTEIGKGTQVNVKYSDFNLEQINYITDIVSKVNVQKDREAIENIEKEFAEKEEQQKEYFFIILIICGVVGMFVSFLLRF